MLLVFSQVTGLPGLYVAALMFGLGFAGIMPCYALIMRALFPVNQIGWRVGGQYLFAALGMALGGWMAGAIHDLTGGYAAAFLAGFAFNIINLVIIAGLHMRQLRLVPG